MSNSEELSPQYDPRATEPAIYERWMQSGVFRAEAARSRQSGGDSEPFVIVMPPPNVTAILHVGHGLDNVVQDVLTRWRRMAGDQALWLPGTDHAGIATQHVVEKVVATETGKTRQEYGREAFVKRTERFVAETGGVILDQLRAIGASADWSRTKYTLSPELSRSVREAFVLLYEDGLIYRGKRVHHWCTHCLTSLSDEEAEHADERGALHYIHYPLESGDGAIMVATTRPETMLGDVAVAVHPADERYASLIGKRVILPIVNIPIAIIADDTVDQAFGTGAVKITPAHDPNDFEMGVRHSLPMPVVISPTGKMEEGADAVNRVPPELRGLDRFEARARIVEMLRASGQLVKIEPHDHSIRHCYRCDTVVEPRLSDQWFVKMKPLAEPALQAVRDGRIRIVPGRWEAVYYHWMENIRDWNISRQLWWGHRIPVFYCDHCGWQGALREDPSSCPRCSKAVRQDEDVLDTWFSSWLWPISTLGWPDRTSKDLKAFYPGDVLVSGPDILFFWIARMVMSGMRFMGDVPFHTIYLHGIVRDTQHRKMSKSLGNGIDPMDVVRLYGADALRHTLIAGMGLGTDVILDPEDLEKSFSPGRNFITKLWNIGRFLLSNIGTDAVRPLDELDAASLTRSDRWILNRLDTAIRECDEALGPARPPASNGDRWPEASRFNGMRLNEYAETARRFVWNELADWYVEAIKQRLAKSGPDREVARAVLLTTFDAALRMLHPIVPFVTEALWQRLPGRPVDAMLASSAWPRASGLGKGAEDFESVRAVIVGIRQVRSDYAIPPGTMIDAMVLTSGASRTVLEDEAPLIGQLARCRCSVVQSAPSQPGANVVLPNGIEIIVPLAGLVDLDKECARVKNELEQLEKQLTGLEQRLQNEKFMSKAPPNVVEAERQKQREWSARREHLSRKVRALCGD
jgi:valyl-tRNA synthetase